MHVKVTKRVTLKFCIMTIRYESLSRMQTWNKILNSYCQMFILLVNRLNEWKFLRVSMGCDFSTSLPAPPSDQQNTTEAVAASSHSTWRLLISSFSSLLSAGLKVLYFYEHSHLKVEQLITWIYFLSRFSYFSDYIVSHVFPGVYLSKEKQVFQTPTQLLMKPNSEVNLTLTHEIPSYDTILWYQRSPGNTSLKLIGYVSFKNSKVEPQFQSHFKMSGDGEKTVYLHILSLTHPEHSGEYFGAASMHSNKRQWLSHTKTSIMNQQRTAQQQETTETTKHSIINVKNNCFINYIALKWGR